MFTPAGNLRYPGYAKAITWISEIWALFDIHVLANSFDQCGIASSGLDFLHLQLRNFISTAKFVDTMEQTDEVTVEPREGDAQDESFGELDSTMDEN